MLGQLLLLLPTTVICLVGGEAGRISQTHLALADRVQLHDWVIDWVRWNVAITIHFSLSLLVQSLHLDHLQHAHIALKLVFVELVELPEVVLLLHAG